MCWVSAPSLSQQLDKVPGPQHSGKVSSETPSPGPGNAEPWGGREVLEGDFLQHALPRVRPGKPRPGATPLPAGVLQRVLRALRNLGLGAGFLLFRVLVSGLCTVTGRQIPSKVEADQGVSPGSPAA